MEPKLAKLSINQDTPKKPRAKQPSKSPEPVADSWDDEVDSSDTEPEVDDAVPPKKSPVPNAPPPTPASPSSGFSSWGFQDSLTPSTQIGEHNENQRRPEKSTAVAGRLIAAGLGMKAPMKTEEQKAYDRALRENEIKRRNKEREAKEKEREENEKARTVMWES